MDYFAHKIHKSKLINGVVCLEFCVLQPDASGQFDPEAEVKPEEGTFTVNIPLGGFVRSMGVMRELMLELKKEGLLQGPAGQAPEGGRSGGTNDQDTANRKTKTKMRDLTVDEDSDEKLL